MVSHVARIVDGFHDVMNLAEFVHYYVNYMLISCAGAQYFLSADGRWNSILKETIMAGNEPREFTNPKRRKKIMDLGQDRSFFFFKYYFWRTLNVNTSDLSFWLIALASKSSEMNKEAETNQTKLKKFLEYLLGTYCDSKN